LAEGLPAEEEVMVAKFWAAEAGQRVCAAAQHLHGGIGVDLDYPLHRHTSLAKHVERGVTVQRVVEVDADATVQVLCGGAHPLPRFRGPELGDHDLFLRRQSFGK